MEVDIYIRERNGAGEIRIPWLPEKINYDSGDATMVTYDIMDKGPVAIQTGTGLKTVSWESIFPGIFRRDESLMRGDKEEPKTYHAILEMWKQNRVPLNVLVVGYPINFDAKIESYTANPEGGFGDISYDVAFVEDRDIRITSMNATSDVAENQNKRTTAQGNTYTVKTGDTLWKIAQAKLGAGSKWQTIYNANKEVIESTAKKHGYKDSDNGRRIFPGTVITIPSTTSNKKSTTAATTGSGASGASGGSSGSAVTLTIQFVGDQSDWGSVSVYVNNQLRYGGSTGTLMTLKHYDSVAIHTVGKCNVSERWFTMLGNKTVTITWQK